jgi:autotransporter-associated beta strand protein
MKKSSVLLDTLRRRFKHPVAVVLALLFPLWAVQVRGATLYYQGSNGPWDSTTPQWSTSSSLSDSVNWVAGDIAAFLSQSGVVTLGGPQSASGLIFGSDGFVITGDTLTLSAVAGLSPNPVIKVGTLERAEIDSVIAGTSGLTKAGNGTLKLGAAANTFSGDVVINRGAVVINNQAQLGTGTTVVSVNGLANTGNPGLSGGSLILDGGLDGMIFTRDLSLSGRGPGAVNNGGALISNGNNTLTGNIVLGGTASSGTIIATYGITALTGTLQIGTGGNTSMLAGNGNYIVSGQVTGSDVAADRFAKSGQVVTTTLWLQNPNNNFAETLRIDSGTVRVSSGGALGTNTSTQAVDLNGGTLEVRTDSNGATFATHNVNDRTNSTLFVSRDVAGSAINQTITFGNFNVSASNISLTISGRDGYNLSLGTGGVITIASGNPWTLTNQTSNGTLILNNSYNFADTSGRNMTLNIRGDTVLTGNLLSAAGSGTHNWYKNNEGTLIIQGTAGTFTGSFNVTGTVQVTGMGAFNSSSTMPLQLNAGALDYRGTGETTTKMLNLSGTTGQGIVLADQTSGTGLVFSGNAVGAGGSGAKTFYLGGSSAASIINEIAGVISNSSSATSLTKIGGNTWLYDPAASTYNVAPTGITSGAAASGTNTNTLTVSTTTGIVVGQGISGTNIPGGSVVTSIVNGTTITISNNISTAVAASTALTFTANSNFTGNVTVSGGTLQVRPTAASGFGSDVINNSSQIVFAADALANTQWAGGTFEYQGSAAGGTLTEQVGALTLTAGAAMIKVTANGGTPTLNFASLGTRTTGATLNLNPGVGTAITFTAAAGSNGILGGYATFGAGGTDFAASVTAGGTASALTGQLQLVTTGGTSTVNYQSTGTPAANLAAESINSLKIVNAQTITLGGILTVTSGGILFDNSNGAATIQNNGTATNTLGASASEVIVITNGSGAGNLLAGNVGNALTISAAISGGAGNLTKAGSGVLILSGANAFTGTTTINEGGIQLSGSGTLGGTNASLMMRQGTVLDLNGVNVGTTSAGGLNAFNGAGTITNNAASGSALLRIGNNNAAGIFSGVIQDGINGATVSLQKAGTGTQVISGISTYSGVTRLLGGNLDVATLANIGVASGIGTGIATSNATNAASLVFAGGSLRYVGTNSSGAVIATETPSISINRLFTLEGNGGIYSYGSYGNVVATRNADNAALIFNNTADVSFSGSGARTLTLGGDSAGDNEVDIHLIDNPNGGALSFTKTDAGLWILNPATANTYSGTTTIAGGALQAQDGAGLSTASNLLLSGGVLQSYGTFNRALGTGADQFSFVANGNGGFSASSAELTVDFSAATLGLGSPAVWGSTPNFLGAGALILSNQTALADVVVKGNFNIIPGAAATPTISTTSASATVTITTGNTNGLTVGQAITGTNIPAGTYITAINSANSISISQNASATGTGISATIAAGGYRQIQVDDNTSTNLDFATVSGVIGGTGGLSKIGTGPLILGDANTYSGETVIRQESVFVTSIGAAGATSSSFGTNVGGGIVELGNPFNSTTANLMYVGPGEVTTREIDLVGTTGTRRIDSSGSGPLVLTNLVNTTANSVNTVGGAKTLELHGTNTDANMVTSVLADNAGSLTVTKLDGGVWILNPSSANTFTGVLNASGGLLGLTANGIGSASSITISNGGIFAYGGDLTTSTNVILANNATAVFAGSGNITINGTVTKAAGANDQTFSNNLENGAVLTINGNFINLQNATAARTINVRGNGSTVWNGLLQNFSSTSTTRFDIRLDNSASFTLGGDNKDAALGLTGGILLGQGTLIVANAGGLGPAANNVILDGGVLTATLDLSGANKITNNVFLQGDPVTVNGTSNIEMGAQVNLNASRSFVNNLDPSVLLTISGTVTNSAAATLTIFGSGNTLINGTVGTGTGAQGLQYSGTGALTLTGANAMTGTLTVTRGTVNISGTSGSVNAAAGVTLNAGGTLVLDNSGGNNASGRVASRAFTFNGGALSMIGNGSTETAGGATVNNIMGAISMSGTGSNTLSFATVNFANSGSSWDLSGISGLGSTNKVKIATYQQGGAAFSNAILPRIYLQNDFAAYDTNNGVVVFTAYNNSNNLDGAANGDTMNVTATAVLSASRTLNALKINGSGLSITSTSGENSVLTLTTGSVISTGGNNTLAVSQINLNGQSGYFQVQAGTTLHLTSYLLNGQLTEVGGGTLSQETPSFYNSTTNVMGGTLQLNAGLNAIFPAVNSLNIGIGATVDLNGSSQYLGNLTGSGSLPNTAGTLTNSSLTTSTFVTNGGGTFSGLISGGINLGRVGGGTLTLEMAQTYSGATWLLGGTTALENDATLQNTTSIDINGAALVLNSNTSLQTQNNDRLGDNIAITLRGGTIQVNGRVDTAATETIGAVTLAQGANTIQAATGGTGTAGAFSSMVLSVASLTRAAGTTVNFQNSTALGSIGNFPSIIFATAPTTYGDGVLGAWAISNVGDYAAYNSADGVGTVGNGGYAGYTAGFGSGNITNLGTMSTAPLTTTLSGTTTSAMLRIGGNFTDNLAFTTNTDVLNLELGGLLRSNNVFDTSIGTTAIRGVLTAGGTETSGVRELVVYLNATGNPTFGGAATTTGSNVVTLSSTVGLQPGMTITNAGLPAGTTIVSVDSLTQVTLSQAATATATSQTLTGGSFVNGTTTSGSAAVTMNSTTGIAPGMTLTGTGIPAGSYVVSVDSATQVTLSQAATANGSALSFTVGVSNMIINSVIQDNGFGNMVSLIKSGSGVLNLSASNTYTGGTIVDQGTLNLIGSGVVIPAGGITINNAVLTMLTNNGQIAASNDVTLVGSSTLTLAGGLGLNNTLNSITFNNNGGSGTPVVNIPTNSILSLTSNAPMTVLNSNAATVPTISGGFLALASGANTFSVQGPTLGGLLYTQIGSALSISSVITGTGSSIIKTDTGLLQLSGQNTFDGGISVQNGGLILSGNSTSAVPNTLVSGPLGIGAVSFASGTSLLVDNNSRTVANAMSFAGDPIFNSTGTNVVTMTLNGALSFATQTTTGLVVNIPTPDLNVVLGGPIANIGTITAIGATGANTISKTGPGNIIGLDLTGIGSTVPINISALSNGAFSILHDGDGTGSFQTINLGAITWEPAVTGTALSLTIGRAGTGQYYPLAVNKLIAPAALISSQLANGINLTNNNNYGLLLVDNIAFNTVSANQGPTFTVSGASTSLQLDGLTLGGLLSGGPTGASAVVLTKAGAGVLTLTNTGNTFGGGGSIIDITAGLVAASSDAALGDSGNVIRLSGNNLGYGFRATGTFATSRTFNLNSSASEIEVTQGNTLTLNTAFTFASANNAFRKYDLGTLVLTQPETGWNGVMFVQQGVLSISDGAQLGNASSTTAATATTGASGQAVLTPTGGTANYGVGQLVYGTGIPADTIINSITATTITLSQNITTANPTITSSAGGVVLANVGAALNLTGGVTVADSIFVNASNNATSAGINGGGAIRSTTGINTVAGQIIIATSTADSNMRAATLAADAGATLNITGGVLGQVGTTGTSRHAWVGLGGAGTINITTTGFTNTGTTGIFQLNKYGTGTLNIQVANAFSGRDVIVKQGTLSMNGAGTFNTLGSGQGALRTVYVDDAGTLTLDDSGTNVNNRLGNAALNFSGADFNITGSASGTTTETTTGTMTFNAGATVFTLDAGAGQQLNFTTAAVTRNSGATLLIRADGLGSAAGANVATIQASTATYAFTGELGGTGATNKSILPWAFGNNVSLSGDALGFLTADSSTSGANAGTNRLRLLSASEHVTGITAPVTLNAFENLNLSTAVSGATTYNILNNWQVNSLQLSSGGSLSIDTHVRAFTIESGGLLALAGSGGISGNGYLTTFSNRELIIYNVGDLNMGVAIAGTSGGLTKSGNGKLTLAAGNAFTGTITVNSGTLMLGGGDQTILPNQPLQLLGGNLDLNGTVQNFNALYAQTGTLAVNDGFTANTAGAVINTSASQATLGITTGNVSFRGTIGDSNPADSNIAVVRSQAAGATTD